MMRAVQVHFEPVAAAEYLSAAPVTWPHLKRGVLLAFVPFPVVFATEGLLTLIDCTPIRLFMPLAVFPVPR
jgi:hypothetical protein